MTIMQPEATTSSNLPCSAPDLPTQTLLAHQHKQHNSKLCHPQHKCLLRLFLLVHADPAKHSYDHAKQPPLQYIIHTDASHFNGKLIGANTIGARVGPFPPRAAVMQCELCRMVTAAPLHAHTTDRYATEQTCKEPINHCHPLLLSPCCLQLLQRPVLLPVL